MYHDAPVEAAVAVHRHRHRHRPVTASDEASQRIVAEYQLHRVANFILTGGDRQGDRAGASVSAPGAPLQQAKAEGQQAAPAAFPIATKSSKSGETMCASCSCQSTAAAQLPSGLAPFMRVALQFPDDLLSDSVAVVRLLQEILSADSRYADAMEKKEAAAATDGIAGGSKPSPTVNKLPGSAGAATMDNPHCPTSAIRLLVLADNTFGSCCPDEITAQHYVANCIVHFGDACMSRSTRLPVLYVQPAFHFDVCVPAGEETQQSIAVTGHWHDQPERFTHAEAQVVLGVVQRVVAALEERTAAWCAEQGIGASAEKVCPVRPRLTVVGTYPTKAILQDAASQWKAAADVQVDWPHYEERNGIFIDNEDKSTTCCEAEDNVEHEQVKDVCKRSASQAAALTQLGAAEDWVVNGVRFPRVTAATPASRQPIEEVQYLLFIGATGSSALVHVLTAEQYNQFHYSAVCRAFLEWDSGEEATTVPVVTVLDNTFGADTEKNDAALAKLQSILSSHTSDADRNADRVCEAGRLVSQWMTDRMTDGVSALVTGDYVVAQQALQRRVRQRAFNIESVRASSAIGILVASLAIEGYYELTQQLHQLLRAYGKRSYVIYVGHLNEFKLANFVDTVDCFVAVACPYSRQSHFPEKKDGFMKPIVSPAELLVALTASDDMEEYEEYGMAAVYTTSFQTVLPVLRQAVAARRAEIEARIKDTAAGEERRHVEEERWATSGALVRTGGSGGVPGGALTAHGSSHGALARLYEREYVGLDPRIGETPVQTEVVEGQHGIARGYAKEREEQHAEPPVSPYT